MVFLLTKTDNAEYSNRQCCPLMTLKSISEMTCVRVNDLITLMRSKGQIIYSNVVKGCKSVRLYDAAQTSARLMRSCHKRNVWPLEGILSVFCSPEGALSSYPVSAVLGRHTVCRGDRSYPQAYTLYPSTCTLNLIFLKKSIYPF